MSVNMLSPLLDRPIVIERINRSESVMTSSINFVHLKAMLRKNWLQMKAEKKKSIFEASLNIFYGALIGYEVSLSIAKPDLAGLGFVIFILVSPAAF